MGEWMSVLLEHINETASEAFTRQKTAAMVGLSEYLRELVARRRTEAPRDDLLSAMLAAEAEGDRLSERELIGILAELLHAGFESTANMMADGLRCLLNTPTSSGCSRRIPGSPRRRSRRCCASRPRCCIRSPGSRSRTSPCRRARSAKGDLVLALIASAARDPEFIERPDDFDITRTDNPHMAFGARRALLPRRQPGPDRGGEHLHAAGAGDAGDDAHRRAGRVESSTTSSAAWRRYRSPGSQQASSAGRARRPAQRAAWPASARASSVRARCRRNSGVAAASPGGSAVGVGQAGRPRWRAPRTAGRLRRWSPAAW